MMWRFLKNSSLAGLVLALAVGAASAQTLKERKAQQQQVAALNSEVAYTNQICQSNISASVDWASYAGPVNEASGTCDAALSAIESLCADELSQEEIKKRVDQVVCTKGDERQVSLKKGTLEFQMNGPGMDDFRYIRDYLIESFGGDTD